MSLHPKIWEMKCLLAGHRATIGGEKRNFSPIRRFFPRGRPTGGLSMLKAFIAGAVAIGLIVAPTASGAMSTNQKTHKTHHAQKKMAPGTTTGMSTGTTTGKATSGTKAKSTGY
jgi:hypothetical protein